MATLHTHPEWKLLDFKRYIARSFLEEYGSPSYQLNEDAVPNRRGTQELRLSKQPHLVDIWFLVDAKNAILKHK